MLTLLGELLHLVTILDLIDKNLRGLEAWDIVFVNNDRSIAGNVTSDLLLPLLINKTAEAADINVLAA